MVLLKKENQRNVKLSYESDGKMGKENRSEDTQAVGKADKEFFNVTQGSE